MLTYSQRYQYHLAILCHVMSCQLHGSYRQPLAIMFMCCTFEFFVYLRWHPLVNAVPNVRITLLPRMTTKRVEQEANT